MNRHSPLLVLLLFLLALGPPSGAVAQVEPAAAILDGLSPAERVGQLFVVSYVGQDTGPQSDLGRMVAEHHVGGVVLLAANQNFFNSDDAPLQVRAATEGLQQQALANGPLPLLIAIDQEGDGWPYTRLTGGTTPLPSAMAVGATWDEELAYEMGRVTAEEMAAAGINLLLGPDVDVLAAPQSTSKGDLGTRVFGGDPYWVGQMGRAYIAGVHEGSERRMATVAKHFPGHGGSDRLPDDEVATVDKSLLELRRIELPPFFAVTRFETPDDPAVSDALMSSHIRYRGFQGNIRQFTAPISFDPLGLRTILGEDEFAQWRSRGVMVSDSLGVPAVKKYFDPTGESFPHRQVARDALMAGNDLMVLAQFALADDWGAQLANMEDTLTYFTAQYESDRLFRDRVDEAALRVIQLKLKLYPEFAGPDGQMPPLPEPRFGAGIAMTEAVAEQSATLLFPRTLTELAERLPRPPLRGEPIVIFTDARRVRDCFDCPFYQPLPTDALEQAILRLYGPEGTGQITDAQIISFSFSDLKLFLGVPGAIEGSENPAAAQVRAQQVRALVENAAWILLAMQDINPSFASDTGRPRFPDSDAARWFLDGAADSLFDKRVVAFAFNVPYQLDTTEISKLSAAFALYAKQAPFVEVAARLLFQDVVPLGAPPVTVDAVNYEIPVQLEPDADQPLTLRMDGSARNLVAPAEVTVVTGVIRDRNGNPVPDGTAVEIVGQWRDNPEAAAPRIATTTRDGVARTTVPLTMEGVLELRARAEEVLSQRPLLITVQGPTPTPGPTETPTPTATPTPPPAPGELPPVEPPPVVAPAPAPLPDPLPPAAFLLSLAGTLAMMGGAWALSRRRPLVSRVRLSLMAVIGGMGGYLLWGAIGAGGGLLAALPVALGGALFGLGVSRVGRVAR